MAEVSAKEGGAAEVGSGEVGVLERRMVEEGVYQDGVVEVQDLRKDTRYRVGVTQVAWEQRDV